MKTHIEEEILNEMRHISGVGVELDENEQNSMIPHEIIDDFESVLEIFYLKYWRIYVTIAATIVYIVIIRSLIYVISPLFAINLRGSSRDQLEGVRFNRETSEIELNQLNPTGGSRLSRNSTIRKSRIKTSKRRVTLSEFPSITSSDRE